MHKRELNRLNDLVLLFNLLSSSKMTRLDGLEICGYDFQEPLHEGGLLLRMDTSDNCAVWFTIESLNTMRVDGQQITMKDEEGQECMIEVSLDYQHLEFYYQSHYPRHYWEKLA